MIDKIQLIDRLKIRYPIIQAPMAGVSTPAMAAAASNAGALGSLSFGASNVDQAGKMLAETRALTNQPFSVNLFCHRPAVPDQAREAAWLAYLRPFYQEFGATPPEKIREIYKSFLDYPEMLEMILKEKPAAASFHFGLPGQAWIKQLKEAGIITMATATTAAEADLIEAAGVDMIVAQGMEAGGHRGVFEPENGDEEIGTFALVRMLAAKTRLPVVAAGGIMDGRGIAAAMQLGASAVQLGTAFILCPESSASAAYRAKLKSERSRHTSISSVISGRPARGLINRMYTDIDTPSAPPPPDYPIAYDAGKTLSETAIKKGNHEFAAHWAGQGAPLAREMPAGQLVEVLVQEWQEWAPS